MDTQCIWFPYFWELWICIFCALATDHSLKCHFNQRKESRLPNSTTYTWIVTFFLFIELLLFCCVKNGCVGCKKPYFLHLLQGKKYMKFTLSHLWIWSVGQDKTVTSSSTPSFLVGFYFLLWSRTDLISLPQFRKGPFVQILNGRKNLLQLHILRHSSSVLPFSSAFFVVSLSVSSLTGQFLWSSI